MINLNPKIWGPHGWFFIESIVLSLPDKIPFILQNEIKHFLISLSSLLPCEKCRYHFSEYIKKTNMMEADFSTKNQVFKWINDSHNNVRIINNKKTINLEDTIAYYDKQYINEIKTSYIDILYIIIFIFIIIYLIKVFYFLNSPYN